MEDRWSCSEDVIVFIEKLMMMTKAGTETSWTVDINDNYPMKSERREGYKYIEGNKDQEWQMGDRC